MVTPNHDPLCRYSWNPKAEPGACDCDMIARVRAEERKQIVAEYVPVIMEHLRILADLRARVESLRPGVLWDPYQDGNPDVVLRADVLALLDGGDP